MRRLTRLLPVVFGVFALALTVAHATGGSVGGSSGAGGSGVVDAPPVKVTDVTWQADASSPLELHRVFVTLAKDGPPGLVEVDAFLTLRDGSGAPLGSTLHRVMAPNGAPSTADFNFFGQGILLEEIDSIRLTVCFQNASPGTCVDL